MNVALVVLDTLRKDAFDDHFDWLPGMRFDNAWSTSNWTVPVHASMFTGKYASEVGIYAKSQQFDCEEPLLPERLQEAGYTTRAFSANPNLSRRFGFDCGFDEFEWAWPVRHFNTPDLFDWNEFVRTNEATGPSKYARAIAECLRSDCATLPSLKQGFDLAFGGSEGPDDDGAQQALEWVEGTDFGEKEFLFLNLMEAHEPYTPPEAFRTVESPETPEGIDAITGDADADVEAVRQAYDDSVRYLSDRYERMFDTLRAEFDLVITVSDHGELLGERGMWYHERGVSPELTHVPLQLSGELPSRSAERVTSLLDVHATIAGAAEISIPSRGEDLLDDPESKPYLTAYHGLTSWRYEALEEAGLDDLEQYDSPLHGIALPPDYYGYETLDGWVEQGETDQDPQERLEELRESLDEATGAEAEETITDAARERLEDLGYA